MYDLDLVKVNKAMVKALRICGAIRRHFGKGAEEHSEFLDLEREIREAAGECQRVLKVKQAETKWPRDREF